jgi:hypothetical protein
VALLGMPTSVIARKRILAAEVIVSIRVVAPPFPFPKEVSFYYEGGEDT